MIKANHLPSAERALFFRCRAELPADRVAEGNEGEMSSLAALKKVLDGVWVLDETVIELARGVVKRIRHVLTREIAHSPPARRGPADMATAAHFRARLDGILLPGADAVDGGGRAGGAGDAQSDKSSAGGSSSSPGTSPLSPPPPPPRRRRGGGRAVGLRAAGRRAEGKLPGAAARAG